MISRLCNLLSRNNAWHEELDVSNNELSENQSSLANIPGSSDDDIKFAETLIHGKTDNEINALLRTSLTNHEFQKRVVRFVEKSDRGVATNCQQQIIERCRVLELHKFLSDSQLLPLSRGLWCAPKDEQKFQRWFSEVLSGLARSLPLIENNLTQMHQITTTEAYEDSTPSKRVLFSSADNDVTNFIIAILKKTVQPQFANHPLLELVNRYHRRFPEDKKVFQCFDFIVVDAKFIVRVSNIINNGCKLKLSAGFHDENVVLYFIDNQPYIAVLAQHRLIDPELARYPVLEMLPVKEIFNIIENNSAVELKEDISAAPLQKDQNKTIVMQNQSVILLKSLPFFEGEFNNATTHALPEKISSLGLNNQFVPYINFTFGGYDYSLQRNAGTCITEHIRTQNINLLAMKPVLSAFKQLHEAGFVISDIKKDNLVIDSRGDIHVIDYQEAYLPEYRFFDNNKIRLLSVVKQNNGFSPNLLISLMDSLELLKNKSLKNFGIDNELTLDKSDYFTKKDQLSKVIKMEISDEEKSDKVISILNCVDNPKICTNIRSILSAKNNSLPSKFEQLDEVLRMLCFVESNELRINFRLNYQILFKLLQLVPTFMAILQMKYNKSNFKYLLNVFLRSEDTNEKYSSLTALGSQLINKFTANYIKTPYRELLRLLIINLLDFNVYSYARFNEIVTSIMVLPEEEFFTKFCNLLFDGELTVDKHSIDFIRDIDFELYDMLDWSKIERESQRQSKFLNCL